MTWESDNYKTAAGSYVDQTQNKIQDLGLRLFLLEEFMKKAKPYIDTLALIDSPENKNTGSPS